MNISGIRAGGFASNSSSTHYIVSFPKKDKLFSIASSLYDDLLNLVEVWKKSNLGEEYKAPSKEFKYLETLEKDYDYGTAEDAKSEALYEAIAEASYSLGKYALALNGVEYGYD